MAIPAKQQPSVLDRSTDQTHLALISFMACPRFNLGTDHNLTVPLEPPVRICVGFCFDAGKCMNLTTDIPSLPFGEELFKVPIVIRGSGVFDEVTSYK